MLSDTQLESLRLPIRNLRIFCGALIFGVAVFALVAVLSTGFDQLGTRISLLVALATISAVTMYTVSFLGFQIIAQHTTEGTKKGSSAENHIRLLQIAWIIRFGVIEGACLLNLVITMLEDSLITLFVAMLGMLVMLLAFPRRNRVLSILESRMTNEN